MQQETDTATAMPGKVQNTIEVILTLALLAAAVGGVVFIILPALVESSEGGFSTWWAPILPLLMTVGAVWWIVSHSRAADRRMLDISRGE